MPSSNPSESGVLTRLGGRRGRLPVWVTDLSRQLGVGGERGLEGIGGAVQVHVEGAS